MYKHTKKAAQIEQLSLYEWCHQESNRGHKDFQSFALPTELWHRCFSFAGAKVLTIFESTKSFDWKCYYFNNYLE